jgi:prolycopene isomerase
MDKIDRLARAMARIGTRPARPEGSAMAAYHQVPDKDAYDVVVVGGGMAGLSAGAGLAYRGASVLVVEAHYNAGGYAHAFRRKKFLFDSAVHLTPGGGKGEGIHRLLDQWGVADGVEFIPVQPMYSTIGPGLQTFIRSGKEGFIESHAEYFPTEREGIRKLVEVMDRIAKEIQTLGSMDVPKSQMMRLARQAVPHRPPELVPVLAAAPDDHIKDPVAVGAVHL